MAASATANPGTGQQNKSNKTWRVHVQGYEAVILYPSLVTPAIVEQGMDRGCMTVILAVKENFRTEQMSSAEPQNDIGEVAARKLHSQLCMMSWGNGEVPGPADFQYLWFHHRVISWQHMIYLNHMDAIERWKAGDYRGWYLGEMLEDKDFPVEGFDESGQPRKWGVIHKAAARMYRDGGKGYKHLIQLNFKNFYNLNAPGMYELNYVYFELYNDEKDLEVIAKEADKKLEDIQEEAQNDPPKQPMRTDYTDPDDDVVNQYFAKKEDLEQRPKLLRHPIQIEANKTVGGKELFRLYGADYTTIADGPFLQSRHPVYIPEKWQGKIGVVADLHVSSRQNLYPLVKAQVIPGADLKYSPYIGKIVHNNLESATKLMRDIADQSDLLVIAGDLYDHSRNRDPAFKKTIKTTGDLWQALDYSPQKSSHNEYPREIDGLLMLSRILDIYNKHLKPVIYVAGNHEGYKNPYGISPRVMLDEDWEIRANAVVAADHNLTFYEACLLYGPGSRQTGVEANKDKIKSKASAVQKTAVEEAMKSYLNDGENQSSSGAAFIYTIAAAGAEKVKGIVKNRPEDMLYDTSEDSASAALKLNFRPENFDWLYCLYTPWKDFIISYGTPRPRAFISAPVEPGSDPLPPPPPGRYNFIALGWGDKEDIPDTTVRGGGTLPRAAGACTQEQVDLTEWAVKNSGADCNILLSHFTFICHDRDKPLQDPDARVYVPKRRNAGELTDTLTPWDIGSFYERRKEMYEMLLPMTGNRIHYSICGHSHRAGAYAFGENSWWNTSSLFNSEVKTSARLYSDPKQPERLESVGQNKVLVCGASGPFSYQNLAGELGGFGMDYPQGLILNVPNDAVEWKKDKRQECKPRLAVVLDYLWYVGKCPPFCVDEKLKGMGYGWDNPGLFLSPNKDYSNKDYYSFMLTSQFKKAFNYSHPFRTITLVAMVQDDKDKISRYYLDMDVKMAQGDMFPSQPLRVTTMYDWYKWEWFKNAVGKQKVLRHFLSITFREVPGVVSAENYDLDSPWCFPVTVEGDYKRIYRPMNRIGGELPDRVWYQNNGGDEYGGPNKK